jgi:hypothetical protein
LKEEDSHSSLVVADDDEKKRKEKDKVDDGGVSKKDKKTKKGILPNTEVHYIPFEVKRHLEDYERYLALKPKDALDSDAEATKACNRLNSLFSSHL